MEEGRIKTSPLALVYGVQELAYEFYGIWSYHWRGFRAWRSDRWRYTFHARRGKRARKDQAFGDPMIELRQIKTSSINGPIMFCLDFRASTEFVYLGKAPQDIRA